MCSPLAFLVLCVNFSVSPPPHTQCFIYHIDQGLRSGGGIADVLEPAAGDILRLVFDITFFFVVIIILLAIIQGEMVPFPFHACRTSPLSLCLT